MKSDVFSIYKKGDMVYLRHKIFENIPNVNQAVSTRHGGVSQGEHTRSMNLGFNTCDTKENVTENYRIFCKMTGFPVERLVFAYQTHSDNVREVTDADCGKGIFRDKDYTDIDALVTNCKNVPLVIHTADCVPVSFFDPVNIAIGNAHCGHKGTYLRLAVKTLKAMQDCYGTKPKDVICSIGPAICDRCYEVSKDLYEKFKEEFGYDDAIYIKDNKYYLNLMEINRHQLADIGVTKISVSDLCTCCEKEDLFSHRGLGIGRGLLSSVISIK